MIAVRTTAAAPAGREASSSLPLLLLAVCSFAGWALLYTVCMYPGLGGEINAGDSIKVQVLGHSSILLHGPGYPLVLMLATALRALPLPFEPWQVMTVAVSAVPAALANTLVLLIVQRLTGSLLLGAGTALLAGSTRLLSVQATEAEVYALNLAFLLGILYLLLRFQEQREIRFFLAASALYALSFGNHLMMIMLLPLFLALAIMHRDLVLRPRRILLILLFIVIGASQYLYLAWVAHSAETAYSEYMRLPPRIGELLEYIGGMYFSDLYGSGIESPKNIAELWRTLRVAHPFISLPLIVAGLALFAAGWNGRDTAWRGLALVNAAALCYLPFVLWYGAWDIRAFHLPVLIPLLAGAVACIGWWLRSRPRLLQAFAAVVLIVGAARTAAVAESLLDRQPKFAGLDAALQEIVAKAPMQRPIVAMSYDMRMAALYYELQAKLPPAVYRLEWRVWRHLDDNTVIEGVVFPMTGTQFERLLRHERPEARCNLSELDLSQRVRWRVYAFRCNAAPAPHRLPDY